MRIVRNRKTVNHIVCSDIGIHSIRPEFLETAFCLQNEIAEQQKD